MAEQTLSLRVRKALDAIETRKMDQRGLRNFYENAMRIDDISDEEREAIIAALEKRIRVSDPRHARAMFGPKDAEARDLLRKAHDAFAEEFDLSANRVGSGVKTGGDMISGQAHVSVYLSYKNANRWHAALEYFQKSAETVPIFVVRLYRTGPDAQEPTLRDEFPVTDLKAATARYREHLTKLL